jgi:hypothetical protein
VGYFAYAYVVEGVEEPALSGIALTRSVYRAHLGSRALFSWDVGRRPPGMYAYADNSLFSSEKLEPLPGYPLEQNITLTDGEMFLLEEGFAPQFAEEPVLYHLLLPRRFVPRPDRKPLEQPAMASVATRDDRLIVSYATQGKADIRFWLSRLEASASITDYDLTRILKGPVSTAVDAKVEFNLGVVKFTFGKSAAQAT